MVAQMRVLGGRAANGLGGRYVRITDEMDMKKYA